MEIPLRDYQTECLDVILSEYEKGVSRQLISLPTGSGKTVIMSSLARKLNKKTLIIAHRQELIDQAVEKFKLFWPNSSVGICMGGTAEIDCQVVVGSVQSCSQPKRLAQLKEQRFELLMIDEAHHATATSYQSVIDELGFNELSNNLLVGVTATADREGLWNVFQKITYSKTISTMIRAGYLSPVKARKILTNFSLGKINIQNGDFAISQLGELVNTLERNQFIVQKFLEYAKDRKGIAFCVDVQHCHDLSKAFREAGVDSLAVYGSMPPEERKRALEGLKSGKIQIATSCGVLTEGFDEPSISTVIMGRPTRSQSLYIQCVGRGLRIFPSKESCLILDFTDKGHSLNAPLCLSKSIPELAIFEEIIPGDNEIEEAEKVDKSPRILVTEKLDEEFDILGSAHFIWIPVRDEWSLMDDEKREIVMTPCDGGFIATLHLPNGSARPLVEVPLPLDYCSGVCEDFARKNLEVKFAKTSSLLKKLPCTPGQKEYLKKKSAWFDGITKAQASLKIREIITLQNKQRRSFSQETITEKQRYYLRNNGIKTDGMSKLLAMQAISKLKTL